MKKLLLLLAFTLGTHISATTIKETLGELGESYLATINAAQIHDFQKRKRLMVQNMLNRDISTVKTEELADIAATLADFANVVTPLLKQSKASISQEEFITLVQRVKSEMEALATKRAQEAVASVATRTKTVSFTHSTLDQESETDEMPEMIRPSDNMAFNQIFLVENVRILNEMSKDKESSSDIDAHTVIESYKDIFKKLIEDNEWSRKDEVSDEENCKELLQLYFDYLGLIATDYDHVLPAFTDALVVLQNEMRESPKVALPLHPSLQGRTLDDSIPEITIIDTDVDAADIKAANADIATKYADIEAMINRLTKPGKIKHEDFIALGSAFEFYEIKQMLAQNLRGLEEVIEGKEPIVTEDTILSFAANPSVTNGPVEYPSMQGYMNYPRAPHDYLLRAFGIDPQRFQSRPAYIAPGIISRRSPIDASRGLATNTWDEVD